MKKKVHNMEFLSKAGPYSHMVEADGILFLSGMLPIDMEKGLKIQDNIEAATDIVLSNIKRALESVGSGMDRVVKVTVFLRDIDDFSVMNNIYKNYFTGDAPARSCIAVKGIPGNYPLEIEAIAIR